MTKCHIYGSPYAIHAIVGDYIAMCFRVEVDYCVFPWDVDVLKHSFYLVNHHYCELLQALQKPLEMVDRKKKFPAITNIKKLIKKNLFQ